MARGRVELKRIQNPASRQVTFSKRRNGLLKKACELSVLCDAEVAVIVISPTGKIYEFASHGMSSTLEKYQKMTGKSEKCEEARENNKQFSHLEIQRLQEKFNILETTQKHMVGQNLDELRLNELERLEQQLEAGAKTIRARKKQILSQHIQLLKAKKIHVKMKTTFCYIEDQDSVYEDVDALTAEKINLMKEVLTMTIDGVIIKKELWY